MNRTTRRVASMLIAAALCIPALPSFAHGATPEASPTSGATQVLQSTRYGFFLGLYAGWELADQSTDGDTEHWTIRNGTMQALVDAYPATDAASCLSDTVAGLTGHFGSQNVALRQSVDPHLLPGLDLASAAAIYAIASSAAGTANDLAVLIQCRPISNQPAPAMLRLVLETSTTTFQDDLRALFVFLDGVVLPPATGEAVPAMLTQHVLQGEQHDPYNSAPPTSGPHYGFTFAPWGVATQPIAPEVFVHNLEHGGVLLLYRSDCDCAAVVAMLKGLADPATGYPVKVLAAPYDAMPTAVALVSWHELQALTADQVTEAIVRAFIAEHIDHGFEYIPAETEQLDAWRKTHPNF